MQLEPGKNHTQLTIDFREYLDGLFSYAVVLSRNRTEAEDLVQETCLRALRAMKDCGRTAISRAGYSRFCVIFGSISYGIRGPLLMLSMSKATRILCTG